MNILQEENNGKGAFYIEDDKRRGEMTYYIAGDKMVIEHTEIDEHLRGKDVGMQLVERGVEYAREKKLKIVPVCPYVKSVFTKTNRFDDVWK